MGRKYERTKQQQQQQILHLSNRDNLLIFFPSNDTE